MTFSQYTVVRMGIQLKADDNVPGSFSTVAESDAYISLDSSYSQSLANDCFCSSKINNLCLSLCECAELNHVLEH